MNFKNYVEALKTKPAIAMVNFLYKFMQNLN
jgi:hypothetical protein